MQENVTMYLNNFVTVEVNGENTYQENKQFAY